MIPRCSHGWVPLHDDGIDSIGVNGTREGNRDFLDVSGEFEVPTVVFSDLF